MEPDVIDFRNIELDRFLAADHLLSANVEGDGNCLFRAISYCPNGHQNEHSILRYEVCQHLLHNYKRIFELDDIVGDIQFISDYVKSMLVEGTWAGEECIMAAADYLQRPIYLFKYCSTLPMSPIIYSPRTRSITKLAIKLAFYEPGHYRSIINSNEPNITKNSSTSVDFIHLPLNSDECAGVRHHASKTKINQGSTMNSTNANNRDTK